jgi:uncharacterized protein
VSTKRDFFLLNIGFIIHETIGYSRDFPIEAAEAHLNPDLDIKNLWGEIRVTRTAQGLLLQAMLRADTEAECVRCLASFDQRLNVKFTELYAFSNSSITESGLLVPESGKIDLEPIFRDELLVAFPINPLCKPDCKGLCPVCGENMNERTCEHQTEPVDPRLEILKSLLNDQGSDTDQQSS